MNRFPDAFLRGAPSKHSLNAPGQPGDNGRCFQKANWHPRTHHDSRDVPDGSASAGTKDGGAGVIVTRGDPADPTILHQNRLHGAAFTSSYAEEAPVMQLALEWATTNHPEYSLTICTDSQSLINVFLQ